MAVPIGLAVNIMYYLVRFGPEVLNLIIGKDIFSDSHKEIAVNLIEIMGDHYVDLIDLFTGECVFNKRCKCKYSGYPNCFLLVELATNGKDLKDWNLKDFQSCKYRGKEKE